MSYHVLFVNSDRRCILILFFFFFNDTATTEIYTLSLHDALPIYRGVCHRGDSGVSESSIWRVPPLCKLCRVGERTWSMIERGQDRKSTRLNSSHANISYAVFCLKKKNNI